MALTDRSQSAAGTGGLRRNVALALGDFLAFNIVTTIGLMNHGELTGLDRVVEIVIIAAPFAAGWFVVSPVMGTFKPAIVSQPRQILPRTALAWLLALPIGLLLWSIVRQRTVQPSFAVWLPSSQASPALSAPLPQLGTHTLGVPVQV